MSLMSGKKVVIFGVANKRSIAWGIAQALLREGASLALNYQNERMQEPVGKLAAELPGDTFLAPCDVTVPGDIERFFAKLASDFGPLDGLVHSIAFAKREELGGQFVDTSWDGYQLAQQVSAWSLIGLAKGAVPLMEGREGAMVCLSYYGAEKVVPNYNVMGPVKAALEATCRYLAYELGEKRIRVHPISPGPLKTRAASGLKDFDLLLNEAASRAPIGELVDIDDVGYTCAYLATPYARRLTGQTTYVDGGVNIMA